jgi:RNA polymerase sigma-70 factor (ECF subfamily)
MIEDDLQLMRRLRAGESQAMDTLLTRHWEPLLRYCMGLLGSWDSAEDIAQESFVKLWAKRAGWAPDSAASALLHRIARNAALDLLKSPRNAAGQEDPAALIAPGTPAEEVEVSELREAAMRAVSDLPPRRREVFRLARESGLSYAEIGEVMGVSRQTVANQMSLALNDLRVVLRAYLPGEAPHLRGTGAAENADAGQG